MNFENSLKIKDLICNSKNILLCLHESPDPDSIVSNILMSRYLDMLNKKFKIVCFDNIPQKFRKLYKTDKLILDNLSIDNFNIDEFDLFISLDVNDPSRCGFPSDIKFESSINIDHHGTKNVFSGLKINDSSYSCTTEMLFYFLQDVDYILNKDEADLVLLGIITDTDSFNYVGNSRVFKTTSTCIDMGGDFENISGVVNRNNSLGQLKYWAESLRRIKIDKKYKFAYTSMDLKTSNKYPDLLQANRTVADKFIRSVEDTDFGIAMIETEDGSLKISVRSRDNSYNVLPLLKSLNGGGHLSGGGGTINLPYKAAVKETLRIAREFVKSKLQENEKNI